MQLDSLLGLSGTPLPPSAGEARRSVDVRHDALGFEAMLSAAFGSETSRVATAPFGDASESGRPSTAGLHEDAEAEVYTHGDSGADPSAVIPTINEPDRKAIIEEPSNVTAGTGVLIDEEIDAEIEAEIEVETDAEIEPETETEIETGIQREIETGIAIHTTTDFTAEVETEADPEAEPGVEAEVEAEAAARAEPGIEAEAATETEAAANAEQGIKSEAATETEVATEVQPDIEAETDQQIAAEPDTETKEYAAALNAAGAADEEPELDAGYEPGTGSRNVRDREADRAGLETSSAADGSEAGSRSGPRNAAFDAEEGKTPVENDGKIGISQPTGGSSAASDGPDESSSIRQSTTNVDVNRSSPELLHADQPVRAADGHRSSHRHAGNTFRVWHEASTTSPAGSVLREPSTSTPTASESAHNSLDPPPLQEASERASTTGLETKGSSTAGVLPSSAQTEVTQASNTRPEDGTSELRPSETRSGSTESGTQSDTGSDGDFSSDTHGETDVAFDEIDTSFEPHDVETIDPSLDEEAVTIDADLLPDTSTEASTEASAEELAIPSEKAVASTAAASLDAVRRTGRPFHGTNAAWLHALLADRLGALSLDQGWKVLEMQLEEGQGTMTVRARRDEDHVSIAVTFSDPQTRAVAAEGVDRLRETLRDHYEASVDLSLSSDGAGQAPQERNAGSRGRGASLDHSPHVDAVSILDRVSATRAALVGARNEWIG